MVVYFGTCWKQLNGAKHQCSSQCKVIIQQLSNQRLMGDYLPLYLENPSTQTNIYSGIVTIIIQPSTVKLILLPIGQKQFVINLSFSKKKWSISEKHSHIASTPNGPWTGWRKRLTRPTSEVSNVANTQGTAGALPTTNEVKTKGHIAISYTQGLCKSIKKTCSMYGIQTYFKGNSTIKNLLVSPKDKDPMANKSGAIY